MGQVGTYNGKYNDGSKSYGGYADYARHPGHFVIPIPDGLPSEVAAPMLCGGITVYHPLKVQGAAPGKKVGIVGIGGLGHFGILFAKALGAEVVAISTSESKKEDAMKMGATKFIATNKGKSVFKENARTLDFIGTSRRRSGFDSRSLYRQSSRHALDRVLFTAKTSRSIYHGWRARTTIAADTGSHFHHEQYLPRGFRDRQSRRHLRDARVGGEESSSWMGPNAPNERGK